MTMSNEEISKLLLTSAGATLVECKNMHAELKRVSSDPRAWENAHGNRTRVVHLYSRVEEMDTMWAEWEDALNDQDCVELWLWGVFAFVKQVIDDQHAEVLKCFGMSPADPEYKPRHAKR